MDSSSWSGARQVQHHPGAINRFRKEYKTNGASHNSIHISSSRTAQSSSHCLQDYSTEGMARQTSEGWINSCSFSTRMESAALDSSKAHTDQNKQEGYLPQCHQPWATWILRQKWTSLRSLYPHALHRCQKEDVLWTSVFHIKGGTTEETENSQSGTTCSYTIIQCVQEGHTCPQSDSEWVLSVDRSFLMYWCGYKFLQTSGIQL